MKKYISFILILTTQVYLSACCHSATNTFDNTAVEMSYSPPPTAEPSEFYESSTLTVHYMDVGQADAALIQCGDDTMLIDGGNAADSDLIIAYLKKLNVKALDYMICTHAHEDHVGGLSAPLSVMTVGSVYAPVTESDSEAYQTFKQKVNQQNKEIVHPIPAETMSLGNARVQFIGPVNENTDNLNNTSIVLKVTYGNTSFLFTGDAERDEEQDIINAGYDISADVLKLGHHGSDSSTSYVFLHEVMPRYAVISVGEYNSYGHPAETVLSRLSDAGTQTFRTDLQGDIVAVSDGNSITITTEKNKTAAEHIDGTYTGNKNSKKFHRPDCRTLPAEKNRVEFSSREEAINSGYSPCSNCAP